MSLKQKITESLPENRQGVEVFIFGSVLDSESPRDIDIAIIYDKSKISLKDIVKYRQELRDSIGQFFEKTDILALSKDEDEELEFIQNTKTEKL